METSAAISRLRIGHGMDVHGFGENRRLIIGGVEIPWTMGLVGHSDADVLCHAVADALLGAARLGDIGKHFPPDDPTFKDANSLELLNQTAELVRDSGFEILDCDAVIAAQEPKLSPYRDAMRENLAKAMGVSVDSVGLKATTTEGLGFVGRKEGIMASAVCLIAKES